MTQLQAWRWEVVETNETGEILHPLQLHLEGGTLGPPFLSLFFLAAL